MTKFNLSIPEGTFRAAVKARSFPLVLSAAVAKVRNSRLALSAKP